MTTSPAKLNKLNHAENPERRRLRSAASGAALPLSLRLLAAHGRG